MHKWQEWSPWAERDPDAKYTFEGPDAGEGAKCMWDGNDEVGSGSMTIVESKPNELVRYKLEFIRPYEGHADVSFTLTPQDEGTEVTWDMQSENNFISKAMCLFMDMEDIVGKDFELGLASLKTAVEESADSPTDDNATDDNHEENADKNNEE